MEKVKISDCCIITNGFAFKSDKYVDRDGARVIRITNVQKGKIVDNDPKFYPFDLLKNLDAYKIFEGDILMSLTGNVGRVGKFPKEMVPGYINQRICRIMPKDERLDVNYLFQLLNSDKFETEAMRNSSGAAQLNLSSKWLNNYEIPLPPLHIQKAIAAKLDKAQEIISYNQQLLEKYDQLTQSLFIDMFGDPVKNEMGWEVKNLGNITHLITDGKHGNCSDEPGSGYYFISAKDVRNNKINYTNSREIPKKEFEEVDKRTNLQSGDLVMINTGATIGRMAIALDIPETRRSTFQKSVAIIKVKKDIISSFFLQYVLELGLETFANMGSGSAIKNLLLSEMRRFKIIIPDLNLQNQFAERIAQIEIQKTMAQESLAKSQELFQSLLKESFK